MQEGLPQSKMHHLGGGVGREDAGLHLEDDVCCQYDITIHTKLKDVILLVVFRHYV